MCGCQLGRSETLRCPCSDDAEEAVSKAVEVHGASLRLGVSTPGRWRKVGALAMHVISFLAIWRRMAWRAASQRVARVARSILMPSSTALASIPRGAGPA